MDHPALHEHECELLQSLVESLGVLGVQARSELRVTPTGRIAEHLLDVAAEWRADLLIAAAGRPGHFRGRPWWQALERLLREAPCPVLVLPREPSKASRSPASNARSRITT
jgi:nucleotide-binding universal stress UspA family protein